MEHQFISSLSSYPVGWPVWNVWPPWFCRLRFLWSWSPRPGIPISSAIGEPLVIPLGEAQNCSGKADTFLAVQWIHHKLFFVLLQIWLSLDLPKSQTNNLALLMVMLGITFTNISECSLQSLTAVRIFLHTAGGNCLPCPLQMTPLVRKKMKIPELRQITL